MKIRNNSKNQWLNYNCGSCRVDILPESEFEVDEKVGMLLLRNLGSEKWLVEVKESTPLVQPVEEPEEEPEEPSEELEVVEEPKPFCESCDSKGVRHKKDCTRDIE